MPPHHTDQRGFAIVEVLLGLLVLGIGLLGAGSALVRNMQASHEISLVLRAADLAADLGEELATGAGPDLVESAYGRWQSRAIATLPAGASASISPVIVPGTAVPPLTLSSARIALTVAGAVLDMELLVAQPAPGTER